MRGSCSFELFECVKAECGDFAGGVIRPGSSHRVLSMQNNDAFSMTPLQIAFLEYIGSRFPWFARNVIPSSAKIIGCRRFRLFSLFTFSQSAFFSRCVPKIIPMSLARFVSLAGVAWSRTEQKRLQHVGITRRVDEGCDWTHDPR